KFGGTSVGTVESIKSVLDIVKKSYDDQEKPLVVLSAMSGVTNLLTKMAENAAERIPFDEDLKQLEHRHFEVVKALIAVKYHYPVLTKLKLMINKLDDILQGVSALKDMNTKSQVLIVSFGDLYSNYIVSQIMEQ